MGVPRTGWSIPCRDAAGRSRTLAVRPAGDRSVVLWFPPAGTAALEPAPTTALYVALGLVERGETS